MKKRFETLRLTLTVVSSLSRNGIRNKRHISLSFAANKMNQQCTRVSFFKVFCWSILLFFCFFVFSWSSPKHQRYTVALYRGTSPAGKLEAVAHRRWDTEWRLDTCRERVSSSFCRKLTLRLQLCHGRRGIRERSLLRLLREKKTHSFSTLLSRGFHLRRKTTLAKLLGRRRALT